MPQNGPEPGPVTGAPSGAAPPAAGGPAPPRDTGPRPLADQTPATAPAARAAVPTQATRPVDARALQRIRRRLDAAAPPWLHGEVARRMAERLAVVRMQPQRVLDWHAHRGASHALLRQAYPQAEIVAVEASPARRQATQAVLAAARGGWWPWRRAAPAVLLDDAPAAADAPARLLWSNMALHLLPDPPAVFAAWHRALAVDGFLMFSTLGPGSLQALRALYAARGWGVPHAPFVDMHDLGDMLVQAGFADPVMDQETLTLTWPDAAALLAELRGLGGNADPGRWPALRGRRWRQELLAALDGLGGAQGRPSLEFEVVYGHAFRPPPRPRVSAVTTLHPDDLRAMARRRGGGSREPGPR